jgi:hypothetical protein
LSDGSPVRIRPPAPPLLAVALRALLVVAGSAADRESFSVYKIRLDLYETNSEFQSTESTVIFRPSS